jgi:hypothetical protein
MNNIYAISYNTYHYEYAHTGAKDRNYMILFAAIIPAYLEKGKQAD